MHKVNCIEHKVNIYLGFLCCNWCEHLVQSGSEPSNDTVDHFHCSAVVFQMSHAATSAFCRSIKLQCELYPSREVAICLDPYCGLGFVLWCLCRWGFSSAFSGTGFTAEWMMWVMKGWEEQQCLWDCHRQLELLGAVWKLLCGGCGLFEQGMAVGVWAGKCRASAGLLIDLLLLYCCLCTAWPLLFDESSALPIFP